MNENRFRIYQSIVLGQHSINSKIWASGCIAIGYLAGDNNQGNECIAIGSNAANTDQTNGAIAIGDSSGYTTQGFNSIAIGKSAGYQTQSDDSIAIGFQAGYNGKKGESRQSIAIGYNAGYLLQGLESIAIGQGADPVDVDTKPQGDFSIIIGNEAQSESYGITIGNNSQSSSGTVCIGNYIKGSLTNSQDIVIRGFLNGQNFTQLKVSAATPTAPIAKFNFLPLTKIPNWGTKGFVLVEKDTDPISSQFVTNLSPATFNSPSDSTDIQCLMLRHKFITRQNRILTKKLEKLESFLKNKQSLF